MESLKKYGLIVCIFILAIVGLMLFSIILQEGSKILSNICQSIQRDFYLASRNIRSEIGRQALLRIFIITGVVSWIISRFKNKNKK